MNCSENVTIAAPAVLQKTELNKVSEAADEKEHA
jgi:hypothetical protein